MVFNATFNNIWAISWQSVLLVKETGVPWENHWSVASHWQTLSHRIRFKLFQARCTRYNIMWKSLSVTCNRYMYNIDSKNAQNYTECSKKVNITDRFFNLYFLVIHPSFMLFVFIYVPIHWCPTQYPYQMMFVLFNTISTKRMGANSGAGTAYPSGAFEFTPVEFVLLNF